MHYSPYTFLAVFAAAALGFAIAPLAIARIWARLYSPGKPGPIKNEIYECGLKSEATGWVQFKSEYYLYGIVFLIFDVETIFLLPFAVAFTGLPLGACLAMLLFILLLMESLVWACWKGVL